MTGINDVATGSHDDFREKYSLLLQQLISILPGTTIVVQSMLPVNNLQYKFSCDNKQIELRNKVIEQLSHESGLQYLDLFSLYETNGYMMAEMTNDGIHLKTAAYQKWYSMMLSLYK
jgi:lysophospholipase L1-like esterase